MYYRLVCILLGLHLFRAYLDDWLMPSFYALCYWSSTLCCLRKAYLDDCSFLVSCLNIWCTLPNGMDLLSSCERMISDQQFSTTFFLLITENAMDNMPFCLSQNMIPEKTSNFERLTKFRKGIKSGCIKNPWPELKWKKKHSECQIEMWVRLAGLCYFVHAAVSQATSWFITHRLSYEQYH